jgi:di/tricarboxylate transporter
VTFEIALVLVVLVVAMVLFAWGRWSVDLVALMVMTLLLLLGLVTPEQGIAGFSNTATVTVGAMFILSGGLFRSGAVNFAGAMLTRLGRSSIWIALVLIMVGIGGISAFMNNTAAVAIFLPIVVGTAKALKVNPGRLLMPLSFASMFGGVCTLIGTSTNILVSSIAEQSGQAPFGMFEMTKLGLIFFGVGMAYMLLIGVRLIPERTGSAELGEQYGMAEYLLEVVVGPEAKSVGHPIGSSPLVKEVDVDVLDLFRGEERIPFPPAALVVQAGDVLRLRANVADITALLERQGITIRPKAKWFSRRLEEGPTRQVEVILAPHSRLEGRTLRESRFAATFGAMVLAIRQRGRLMHEDLENTQLQAGDALLVEAPADAVDVLRQSRDFVLVTDLEVPEWRREKILPAVAILAGVVVTASMGILPILVAAITGCILMVLTRCLSLEEAYEAIDWKVIFLLAGILTLGRAMENTGTASFLADLLVSAAGSLGPVALVAAFYLLTSLLTEAMSNNATAVLLAPVAIATADSLGVDARPLLMAVAFAASASFMTPMGYQTNTMIFSAGGFKFMDFVRVGGPLNLIFWVLATIFIPIFWPF